MHKIKWTNATWNFVLGCLSKCSYCYARKMVHRVAPLAARKEIEYWVARGIQYDYDNLIKHIKSFKPSLLYHRADKTYFARKFGDKPKKIFVNSMSDVAFWPMKAFVLFNEILIDYPQHTFQILTKFPEKIQNISFPENVWLGISAETQSFYNYRVEHLIKIKAGKHFVSLEPLQEEIDLCTLTKIKIDGGEPFPLKQTLTAELIDLIDWVIVGGQTGPNPVLMEPHWVINIKNQCEASGVPFFFKSWGGKLKNKETIDEKEYKYFPE